MIKGGPRIVTDGLVLCLDAHDAKSYAGEPTTNLSPNSDYSGASLNTINSGSNGGWGTTFDRWISEIEGPGGKTVKAFHLKLTGSTGSAPHAEGDASLVSGIASQVASLTSGNSYRVSAWAKVIRANGSSTAQTSSNLLYLTGTAAIGSSSLTVNTTWTRISASFSISTTGSYRLYHYFYSVSVGDILVITEPQIELKSYNTPYVYSSRSATNGWVDRSGNSNSGTLTNMIGTEVTHYRDGQVIMPVANSYLNFDGSNDYVDCGSSPITSNSSFSWEAWIYPSTTGTPFFMGTTSSGQAMVSYWDSANNKVRVGVWASDKLTSNTAISGGWGHTCWTWDGTTLRAYTNGVADGTATGFSFNIASNYMMVGSAPAAQRFGGKIGSVKLYNKALTAAEVLSNYNATKGRFS